jgi:ribonuclease HII
MQKIPSLVYEQELWAAGKERVVGVDEVGRGALCACVVAAAVILPHDVTGLEAARDSKMLSAAQRERLVDIIMQKAVAVGVGAASPRVIERLNIRRATVLAMQRALARVGQYDHLLVDGLPIKEFDLTRQTAIVKGDSLCLSIACASIIAKVCRDGLMAKLALRYPGYNWEHNVGYPTPEHKASLIRLGATPHHRATYAPVKNLTTKPLEK